MGAFSGAVLLGQEHHLSADAQRLAEVIADYDPELRLVWIPPDQRTAFDAKPYGIMHFPSGGIEPYKIMELREDELDHRVLASLFLANQATGNNPLAELEAIEAAQKAMKMKDQLEREAEEREFALWAIRQTKTVQHNGVKYE